MMFTKADRERAERIETALISLRLDVGVRTEGRGMVASGLHLRMNDALSILNELGLQLGRIEQRLPTQLFSEVATLGLRFDEILGKIGELQKSSRPKKKKKR